jgi:hypothetical protein
MSTYTSKAFRFSEEEIRVLEALAKDHGGYKQAVMAGLRVLTEGDNAKLSAAVAAELRRLAAQIDPPKT